MSPACRGRQRRVTTPPGADASKSSRALHFLGRTDDSLDQLQRTENLVRKLGVHDRIRLSQQHFGSALSKRGQYDEAIERHKRALRMYESWATRKGQAIALQGIGWCLTQLGGHDEALPMIRDAWPAIRR